MTRRALILLAATSCAALAACERSSPVQEGRELQNGSATVARTYEGPRPEGVSSGNEKITTTYYIPAASVGDLYEIQSSEIALERSKSPEVKTFAKQMIDDHKKTSADLKRFTADNPVNIAPEQNLDPRRQAMIQNLRNASDAEFDGQYVGDQAAAHQEALNLHQSYARNGDVEKLKTLAASTAKTVAHHAEMLKALQAKVGGAVPRVTGGGNQP